MFKIKLLVAALVASLVVGGCASPPTQIKEHPTSLETQLVQALLAAAEREGRVSTVLLAPNLPPGIKGAVAGIRAARAAKSDMIEGLAKGQLLLQRATLGKSQATLSARLGPVPKPRHNVALLACGTGLTVTFNLVGGQWQQGDLQILMC